MTEDASAGRLYLEVVGDTTGLRQRLQRKIDAETAGMRARVRARVEFRASQARADLNRALREAGPQAAPARARADFQVSQVRAALNRALREAAPGARPARARVDFDVAQTRRNLTRAVRGAAAGVRASDIPVDADTTQARAATSTFRRRQSSDPIEIDIHINPSTLVAAGGLLTSFTKLPAIASGVAVLTGAVVNLGAGLFAAASAASQAVGVIGALPGLVGTAAQGIGALVIGFTGVGEAVKQLGEVEKQGASTARASAQARAAAAQRVADAQRTLADAQRSADRTAVDGARAVTDARRGLARAQETAARQVADAQRALADAQRQARYAQEDLNQARAEAAERLRDLRLELRGAALDEEAAGLAVERARRRLRRTGREDLSLERQRAQLALDRAQAQQRAVRQSADASGFERRDAALAVAYARERVAAIKDQIAVQDLERREADLGFRRARHRLDRAREANQDLRQEYRASTRAGVEGSDRVVAARRRLADAERGVADAVRALRLARVEGARDVTAARRAVADARLQAARADADARRAVADAQRALSRAMADTTAAAGQQTAAMRNLDAAMRNLSPEGRRFAAFVQDTLIPRWNQLRFAVQGALLPPLQHAVVRAMPLLDTLQAGLVDTARRVGRLTIRFAGLAASPAFRSDVATIMASNNRALTDFGQAGIHATSALRHLTVAAGPLLERFAAWTEQLAATADQTLAAKRETGELAAFFDRAGDRAAQLGDILWDLGAAIGNVGEASTPTGDTILDQLADAAERLRRWTGSPEGQAALREFFAEALPVAADLTVMLGDLLRIVARLGDLVGADTLNGLVWVLDKVADALTVISNLPGGQAALTAVFTVSGVLLGMGLLVGWVGKLARHMRALSRLPGLSRLFRSRRGGVGGIAGAADAVDDLTDAMGRELPVDRAKRDRLGDVGDTADTTRRKSGKLGDAVDDLSDDMREGTRRSGGFARGLRGIASAVDEILLGGLGALGAGKLKGLGRRIRRFFGKGGAGRRLGGKALRGLKGGGPVGIALGLGGGFVGDLISGGQRGTARGAAGGAVGGALQGAGIGALVGSVVPVVGTAVGAAVGAGVGALIGAIRGGRWWDDIKGWVTTNAKKVPGWVADGARAGAGGVKSAFDWVKNHTTSAFTDARVAATANWNQMWSGVGRRTNTAKRWVGQQVDRFGRGVVGAYKSSKAWVSWHWNQMWSGVGRRAQSAGRWTGRQVDRFARGVRGAYRWGRDQASRLWNQMWTWVGNRAQDSGRWVGQQVDRFARGAKGAFEWAVRGIDRAWRRLRGVTKRPVNFVIKWVYNRGIRWVWNKVAGLVGMPQLPHVAPLASGGPVPAPEVGWTSRPTAVVGEGSRAHPEVVVPTDPKHRAHALQLYKQLGGRLMAGGGVLGDAWGWITSRVGDAWQWAGRGFDALFTRLMRPFMNRLEGLPHTTWGGILRALPREMVSELAGKLKDVAFNLVGGTGFGGVKPWVGAVGQLVDRLFPGVYSIGGVAPRSTPSDHPRGLALDFMVPAFSSVGDRLAGFLMAQWRRFNIEYLIWKQRIWNPPRFFWRRMADRGGITANHQDHVHASFLSAEEGARMADGGVVRQPTLAMLAEAGHAEAVVDEGLLNSRLADLADVRELLRNLQPTGQQPLVGQLTLVTEKADVDDEIQRALFELRRVRRGGVLSRG